MNGALSKSKYKYYITILLKLSTDMRKNRQLVANTLLQLCMYIYYYILSVYCVQLRNPITNCCNLLMVQRTEQMNGQQAQHDKFDLMKQKVCSYIHS